MNELKKKKVGIVGCGAIGSRIAKSIHTQFKKESQLSALFDIVPTKARQLAEELKRPSLCKASLNDLIKSSDLVVEAISSSDTKKIIRQVLEAGKDILVMSVGQLLDSHDLFSLSSHNRCHLLIPSGAVAGIDAIKAASESRIHSITLTTRKPLNGFANNPYLKEQGIDLAKITQETVVFEGNVRSAVRSFPKNINVAATVALASRATNKLKIRILTSPKYTTNSHEIEVTGDFGRIVTLTDNVVCPDNPKTSYQAVLSAIATLRKFLTGVNIGT